MHRASQVLSDLCVKRLICAKEKISDKSIRDSLSYRNSFKYSLLHEAQIKVEIISATSFSIFEGESDLPTVDGAAILEARFTDFLLGANRVKTQYNDLVKAKDSHTSSAWLLVTAYYCGFYACIELLKAANRIPLGLDIEDLNTLQPRATGAAKALFFDEKPLNFIGQHYANRLVFQSSGAKPHQYAWSQLNSLLKEAFNGKNWPEIEALKKITADPQLNPSKVRNNWNYKRADYYGIAGERIGSNARKLIGNLTSSAKWITEQGESAAQDDSSRIIAICEVLTNAVIDAHDKIKAA